MEGSGAVYWSTCFSFSKLRRRRLRERATPNINRGLKRVRHAVQKTQHAALKC